MGLLDLIERAYKACVRPWPAARAEFELLEVSYQSDEEPAVTLREVQTVQAVMSAAESAVGFASEGRIQRAGLAGAYTAECEAELAKNEAWQGICERSLLTVTWRPLREACEVATRLDALLFSLEKPARSLALACRDDLDSLPILADWCDDNGLPASAAELRHLYGLVRCSG
jgi:hypothetical protein